MKILFPSWIATAVLLGLWGVSAALGQVSHTYTAPPPPGYPVSGALKQPTSVKTTRQSAAAVQPPAVSYPSYPPTYPPPAGYTYPPPPGYGMPAAPKTAKPKTPTKSKTVAKPTPSKKKSYGPPPPPKVYGPTGDLSSQVAKLKEGDRVQNLRLGELERDVSSIKRGRSTKYDGGNDLAAHTTYVARPGDTLFRIASTHRVSVGEIQQLNRMSEDEVHVGQTLLIPSPHRLGSLTTPASYRPSTPGGAVASNASTSAVSTAMYYTVRKGDSLKAIALKHRTTTAALADANRIKNANKIFVGQRLKIPGRVTTVATSSRTSHDSTASTDTVPLPGYGISPPAPALAPPSQAPAPAPAKPTVPDDSHRGILAYRVDRTDTIETIAQQFSTTPEHIREMNRLSASTPLKSGDEIMVPAMGAVSVSR